MKSKEEKRKKFIVLLHRSYNVEILAIDEIEARRLAEYFIGDPKDESSEIEKKLYNFEIEGIEMTYNDAPEVSD